MTGSDKSACGFCKGEPVGNAASWLDGKPRPPAPCPRCGDVNYREKPPRPTSEALWNLDVWLAETIARSLRDFAEASHGYPGSFSSMEEWTACLRQIADELDEYISGGWTTAPTNALNLLADVWTGLWD